MVEQNDIAACPGKKENHRKKKGHINIFHIQINRLKRQGGRNGRVRTSLQIVPALKNEEKPPIGRQISKDHPMPIKIGFG